MKKLIGFAAAAVVVFGIMMSGCEQKKAEQQPAPAQQSAPAQQPAGQQAAPEQAPAKKPATGC